ncbi:MAG: acyl carrier protein [Synergistaceae bacterium]|nr:acyl carrier protein [Synergistaceae bacterium]
MDEKQFLAKVAEIVEEDETSINLSTELEALDAWDSLARITFLVFVSDDFKKRIDVNLVKDAVTIGDLYKLVSE